MALIDDWPVNHSLPSNSNVISMFCFAVLTWEVNRLVIARLSCPLSEDLNRDPSPKPRSFLISASEYPSALFKKYYSVLSCPFVRTVLIHHQLPLSSCGRWSISAGVRFEINLSLEVSDGSGKPVSLLHDGPMPHLHHTIFAFALFCCITWLKWHVI
jgi:hypothetical protein